MTITVRRSGEPVEVTLRRKLLAAVDVIVPMIIGIIQRRTAKGIDSGGTTFKQYADATVERYQLMGESVVVDLAVSGAMLADIGERARQVGADSVVVTIGPGTGTSEQRRPPLKEIEGVTKSGKARTGKALERALRPRAVATPRRSPPHNVLAGYIHNGTPRMPARPFLGLTEEEKSRVSAKLRQLLNR